MKPPTLDLPAASPDVSHAEGPPSTPPPPSAYGERDVKRALMRVEGRPNRVRELICVLLGAGANVSHSLAAKVASTLADDPQLRRALVNLITVPDRPPLRAPLSVSGPPRERLRVPWAASALVSAGPPSLRAAIGKDQQCLRTLATVFCHTNYDAARAALAADVLRAALVDAPRAAADALAVPHNVLAALVHHVDSAPAADLMARLVGTRVFGVPDAGAVVPAHRRALAALARHRVMHTLATRFAHCAKHEPQICAHIASAMGDMSGRAITIPHAIEDPDERGDGYAFGIAHLSIVAAHTFNDAIDYISLPVSPQPLIDVLDIAFEHIGCADVVVAALKLLSSTLTALLDVRGSALALIGTAAREKRMEALEKALLVRIPRLLGLLGRDEQASIGVGQVRLGAVDALSALLRTSSVSTVRELLETHRVLDALLGLVDAYPRASVLHTRVSDALTALLVGDREVRLLPLYHSDVVRFFIKRPDDDALCAHLAPVLEALLKISDDDVREEHVNSQLTELRHLYRTPAQQRQRAETRGLRRPLANRPPPLAQRLALRVPRDLEASEDKGLLLYVRSGVACRAKSDGAHTVMFVEAAHAAFGALRSGS